MPFLLVPGTGLEPALLAKYAPETYASTNSAIRAQNDCKNTLIFITNNTIPEKNSKFAVYQWFQMTPPYNSHPKMPLATIKTMGLALYL